MCLVCVVCFGMLWVSKAELEADLEPEVGAQLEDVDASVAALDGT